MFMHMSQTSPLEHKLLMFVLVLMFASQVRTGLNTIFPSLPFAPVSKGVHGQTLSYENEFGLHENLNLLKECIFYEWFCTEFRNGLFQAAHLFNEHILC